MRYAGTKDGPTMELIALPLLAAFYLVTTPLLFRQRKLLPLIGAFIAGAGFAYCIISLLLCTLGWLPLLDMLENCCVILLLIIVDPAFPHAALVIKQHATSFGAEYACLALY